MVTAGNSTPAAGDIGSIRVELGRTDVVDDRMPGSPHYTRETTKCDRNRLPIGCVRVWVWGGVGEREREREREREKELTMPAHRVRVLNRPGHAVASQSKF
jgi:hypothetical protein